MKNFLDIFFPEKNENYNKAVDKIKNVKKSFDGFVISFPDVTPHEIILIKNQWEKLPKQISKNVELMGVKATKEYKSMVAHYKSNGYVMPHKHSNLYEFGRVLKGQIQDRLTGKIYRKGDEFKFLPNQPHYLNTNGQECILYSILTENENFVMKSLPEKIMKSLNLT
jgi:quercetin dioxygenase-like cupin family protein